MHKMQINDVQKKDVLTSIVISELKKYGIKYKEKKVKTLQSKSCSQRIFRTPLQFLQSTDALLSNGAVVQVPRFVSDACSCILEQVDIEGIFRKAGSVVKQREIRKNLEAGLPLGKSHRVIDVANILSYFFRELPEPLIPTHIHEALIRSLSNEGSEVNAVLLTCLLLPTFTINTMAYLMQFLHEVTVHSKANKMCAKNLAIVLSPGLMPHPDINSARFKNHIKVVQLLIENAQNIGSIPPNISQRMQMESAFFTHRSLALSQNALYNMPKTPTAFGSVNELASIKKKKRRSEMFNGLKKIVGSALGSSENLETTETVPSVPNQQRESHKQMTPFNSKASKKRKNDDQENAFSAKKKRDLFALLPSTRGVLLPSIPQTKEPTKSRISLGGNRHIKPSEVNPIVATMERRWSLVNTGWSKHKKKDLKLLTSSNHSDDYGLKVKPEKSSTEHSEFNEPSKVYMPIRELYNESSESESLSFSKDENEENNVRDAADNLHMDINCPKVTKSKNEPDKVVTKTISSSSTEELAKRLSERLQIRRRINQRIVRSPSDIKSRICKRSQEAKRLSRTQTWHISSTSKLVPHAGVDSSVNTISAKVDSKRDHLSTLQMESLTPVIEPPILDADAKLELSIVNRNEEWTPAEAFFNDNSRNLLKTRHQLEEKSITVPATPQTPCLFTPARLRVQHANLFSPMLPPNSLPRKATSIMRTPRTSSKVALATHRIMASTPHEDNDSGRASIARLRTQNAGMVLAKAKIFDDMSDVLPVPSSTSIRPCSNVLLVPKIESTTAGFNFTDKLNQKIKPTCTEGDNSTKKISTLSVSLKQNNYKRVNKEISQDKLIGKPKSVEPSTLEHLNLPRTIKICKAGSKIANNASPRISKVQNLHLNTDSPRKMRQIAAGAHVPFIVSKSELLRKNAALPYTNKFNRKC